MKHKDFFSLVVEKIGNDQAYFPGTGGNVSFKIDDSIMFIKSSGKRVANMTDEDGSVALKYNPIKNFFYTDILSAEGERVSMTTIKASVIESYTGRPSIETGFHALLGAAVIHSHSFFVNVLTCSQDFEMIVETIFFGSQISYSCIPYAKPGYYLTHAIVEKTKHLSQKPRVFFMKNHGVIVSAETMEEALVLHERINSRIKAYFSLDYFIYPKAAIVLVEEGIWESCNNFLVQFICSHSSTFSSFEEFILFPDLSVFCEDINVVDVFDDCNHKITIEKSTGRIRYRANLYEAECIEENLVAYACTVSTIRKHHLNPCYISKDSIGHIRNMEQEHYRKRLLKNSINLLRNKG
jgi:ribulose-5-phosphate 4-epimerase/fuculose-1-phosphate aldolase